ncbi:NACHT and WD repeat domain-containing protein 2 [Trichonephila clavata]|uniref:NACHT and WD repeat domain-containing protein 2 n=1 Tax=Trichonephila clavata TaxID=2740835 RepID=A0A8X6L9X8_TRICU|nr:NACHT and WD repeat domain-containing protein 2 [Trichonephila clavata]
MGNFFCTSGTKIFSHFIEDKDFFISHIQYTNATNYSLAISSLRKSAENLRAHHILRTRINDCDINELAIDSALYFVDSGNIYASEEYEDVYHVSHFKVTTDGWERGSVVGQSTMRIMH